MTGQVTPKQLELEVGRLIRSPLCIYGKDCHKRGVAELGPVVRVGDSLNREIRCLSCGMRGVESRVCCG
jgi:hypothetical protein